MDEKNWSKATEYARSKAETYTFQGKVITPCDKMFAGCVDGFTAGAKFAAKPVRRLGEIIQQYCVKLPPPVLAELQRIYELNKEIENNE